MFPFGLYQVGGPWESLGGVRSASLQTWDSALRLTSLLALVDLTLNISVGLPSAGV